MGRMADARKRARRGGGAAEPARGAPTQTAEETASAGAAPADFTFPAEPTDDRSGSPSGRVALPSSGLADEVLSRVHVEISSAPRGAGGDAERIELPASGLAEDILPRHERASAPAAAHAPETAEPAEAGPAQSAPAGAHSLSFFAAPVQEQRAAVEATEHLATFYLDREEYGVDVKQVQEIRRVAEITPVPRAPQFVRGVINLRGRILPVLDLRAKLGLGEVAESNAARIIVVRVKERVLGLLVDGASQVLKIPLSRIEAAPEEIVERGGDYIRGVAKLDDRLIILVNLEKLLAHELSGPASRGPDRPAPEAEA